MRRSARTLALLYCFTISLTSVAQNSLQGVFTDLRSPDKKVREAADGRILASLQADMPTIESDSAIICEALSDPDASIRVRASGILFEIAYAYPEHNMVVTNCFAGLIRAASDGTQLGSEPMDDGTFLRRNSLTALAINPAGPPAQARDLFVSALRDSSSRYQGLGALGLLRIANGADESNVQLVAGTLKAATGSNTKMALLSSIAGSGIKNQHLFGVAQEFLYDTDSNVQQTAVEATTSTAPTTAQAVTSLQNFSSSIKASGEAKKIAERKLADLSTR